MSKYRTFDLASRIELKQLRYAVVAAEQGSFRKAAEILNVKQSTLSRSVPQLERAISIVIFDRSPGGIATSKSGNYVIQMAKSVIEQIDTLGTSNLFGASIRSGRLHIGFCTSLSVGGLRTSLLEFRRTCPEFQLKTYERSRARLSTALRNGSVDVVITTGALAVTGCQSLNLWSERVLVALPEDFRLATRETVYWTDLCEETLLMARHDPYWEFEDLLTAKLLLNEDRPRIERHDVSRSILKSLISMKLGLGLTLESDAGTRAPSIVFKELRDGTGPTTVGFLAFWRENNVNPALLGFLRLLRERYRPLC